MRRKLVVVFALACFALQIAGCYAVSEIPPEWVTRSSSAHIVKVVTKDGGVVDFRRGSASLSLGGDSIVGESKATGVPTIVPIADVTRVYISKFDQVRTAGAVVGVACVVGLAIAVMTPEPEVGEIDLPDSIYCCPFVYSHDGATFVLDGEPYGGAICEGLKRSDLCRLDHLPRAAGEFRIMLANELDEIQYIDKVALLAVDCPAGARAVPDKDGVLHTVRSETGPASAVDARGRDQLIWLSDTDARVWESDLLARDPEDAKSLRDTLVLVFPRPAGASECKLIVTGSNTTWSSRMLRNVAELWGDELGQWYEELSTPEWQERLLTVYDREELTLLHVRVWEGGEWVRRGTIGGGGPFVAEERVVPLDLSGVAGDTLKVLLAPPVGFWELNSIAVDYSDDETVGVTRVAPISAIEDDGGALTAILSATDGQYYVASDAGRYAEVTFSEPPLSPGLDRTVFAEVSGFYEMRVTASGPACREELDRIEHEPGYVTKLALRRYHEWWEWKVAQLERLGVRME